MPRKPLKPCSYPGCPNLTAGQYCEKHRVTERRKRVIKRLVERYADHGQVAYISSERVDAKLVHPEAIKGLKIKTPPNE